MNNINSSLPESFEPTKRFETQNVIPVFLSIDGGLESRQFPENIVGLMREFLERQPVRITGLHNQFRIVEKAPGKWERLYKQTYPAFEFHELEGRLVEQTVCDHWPHGYTISMMFIEPNEDRSDVQTAWLCIGMTITEFEGAVGEMSRYNGGIVENNTCRLRFIADVTERSANNEGIMVMAKKLLATLHEQGENPHIKKI